MRILYIEDEKYLADAVIHLLTKSGINVDYAADGEHGLELALKPIYDCIVLDIILPKLSGFEILKTIRTRNITTPVIILSALGETDDKVRGLQQGADDYLAKPFKIAELIARINALTRRPPLQSTTKNLTYQDLTYDPTTRTLNNTPLTEKEAELLTILIKQPEQIHQKTYLLTRIWGSTATGDDNYVEVYISYLRKKLRDLSSTATIKTIRGLGYKLTTSA